MLDKNKTSILLFIVLILISLSFAGGLFFLLQKERAKNVALQDDLQDAQARQKAAEVDLERTKKRLGELETKIKDSEAQLAGLTRQLDEEKSAKAEAQAKADQIKNELEQQKKAKVDLEAKLLQAQDEAKKAKGQLTELEARRVELEAKLREMDSKAQEQKAVELGKIVVGPEGAVTSTPQEPAVAAAASAAAAPGKLEGKVVVVNKDYNFAVINLGAKDGVTIGTLFGVFRGSKYLGDVKIEKVHESMSAAGFATKELKDKIAEGDKVSQKSG